MDETAPAVPPRRRRNWLLIVSLCLNVLLIPTVAVMLWGATHRPDGTFAPHVLARMYPDSADAITKAITAHRDKLADLRRASARARRDAFELLDAPDYSPQKLSEALAKVTAADTALETEIVTLLGESLTSLSPADRKALVERVHRRNRSWWFHLFKPRGR